MSYTQCRLLKVKRSLRVGMKFVLNIYTVSQKMCNFLTDRNSVICPLVLIFLMHKTEIFSYSFYINMSISLFLFLFNFAVTLWH